MDDFNELRNALKEDLKLLLADLSCDQDNYGFALAVPSDYGSACLVYAVGKESKLKADGNDSLDNRYSPIEWLPTWLPLSHSNDALERAVEGFAAKYEIVDDTQQQDQMHDHFITACASACLEVLQDCDNDGLFGSIWYKVLDMSDEEHPVVADAFARLNSGRALTEAAPLFEY